MDNTLINKRATGSYYTCLSVADYICSRVIINSNSTFLEPSFGDGVFLDSARNRYHAIGACTPSLSGVELQEKPYSDYTRNHSDIVAYCCDFMQFYPNQKYSSIAGNPPYVSLKKLDKESQNAAFECMKRHGLKMLPSASLWLPFIVHSSELLTDGGRMGFVLPYEITYVRYSFILWKYLSKNFGKLCIYRLHDDFFPDVDVETIVFLAENKGGKTETVDYKTFTNISRLIEDEPDVSAIVTINDIINMNKPFERELISDEVKRILSELARKTQLQPLLKDCKFKIGYVSGNKSFFHPSKETIRKFKLNKEDVIPCIINSKSINSKPGIGIDARHHAFDTVLFYPTSKNDSSKKYIEFGVEQHVNEGYKCRIRNPWYITPHIETPDLILTVFGDIPRLISNSGRFVVSNSLLSGIMTSNATPQELICRWYNSLTLLMIELNIHSLGGGTLVVIPGEVDKLNLISGFPKEKIDSIYRTLREYAHGHALETVYQLGDQIVLQDIFGITKHEIAEIRSSLELLRDWRRPDNRR
ncbi:MAG: hypothetical protein K5647_07870 [Clostridiales bacterium]|nr:hypothetical protein [Clostridiales bacterium]